MAIKISELPVVTTATPATDILPVNVTGTTSKITFENFRDALSVQGTDIASAATTNIAAASTGIVVTITGSVTITAFGTAPAGVLRILKFSGAPLLTYNATSLKLPGAANYQVVAGDTFTFVSEGSGNWKCVGYALINAIGGTYPAQFDRLTRITGGASGARTTLVITPAGETMNINVAGNLRIVPANTSLDINTSANWIATTYATEANRTGKDFKIYAIENGGALAPTIQCDLAATAAPANSRLIGGFHCLCVAVGTISGHTLTGYVAGDILPASVWDLKWCPRRRPDDTYHSGMVYSSAANIWVDIYLMSGTGTSTASVNGGTISDARNWMDFIDDAGAVGKRLLQDREFQLAAAGCNEGTNITGSADPVTTGGHTDTAGRRIISNIGCEDMAGVVWQWLDEQSYRYDASASTWSWKNVTGSKGQLYTQDSYGDVKVFAGGSWADGASCGSRCRRADSFRWDTIASLGGRAGVEPE